MTNAPLRFRPPSFYRLGLEELGLELDQSLPRLFDSHNALEGQAIQAPAINAGFMVQSGTVRVTGSKLGIVTGLDTVNQVVASINSKVATNFTVTAQPSVTVKGAIDVYVWQPTGAGSTVPIACTTAVTIHWWATGPHAVG
jgi:hypothetical protein